MERVMYNTVLGAKPLMADGRTFYYSDYNFAGRKVYRDDQHWACCSGTLPQVAADYRINTYFPRSARRLGEFVHPLHFAMDPGRCSNCVDPGKPVSV